MTQLKIDLAPGNAFHPSSPAFLRGALLLDAVGSGATALLVLLATDQLAELFAVPAVLLWGAGLVLVPYVAFVAYLGLCAHPPRSAVWTVIVANSLWAAASLLMLISSVVEPTALGCAFVIGQALVVAGFGALQYVALRRQGAPA